MKNKKEESEARKITILDIIILAPILFIGLSLWFLVISYFIVLFR